MIRVRMRSALAARVGDGGIRHRTLSCSNTSSGSMAGFSEPSAASAASRSAIAATNGV